MALKLGDYKRGQALMWRGEIWVIQKMDHVKPGKGPAYLQTDLKSPKTGQNISNRFRSEEQFEPVHFDKVTMDYLYSDNNSHVFMDPESYEQVEVPKEFIGDMAVYLIENCPCEVCSVDGKILTVEFPHIVELTVEDVPPQVKGATATNQPKDALCVGGAKIRVPAFVENGGVIKVDTRTGEYTGRA